MDALRKHEQKTLSFNFLVAGHTKNDCIESSTYSDQKQKDILLYASAGEQINQRDCSSSILDFASALDGRRIPQFSFVLLNFSQKRLKGIKMKVHKSRNIWHLTSQILKWCEVTNLFNR